MTIRKATPAEINTAFEAYREQAGRPLTFEEVQKLDADLAREIERDESQTEGPGPYKQEDIERVPPKHTPHGNYRRADYFETQCKILEVDLAVCMEARRTLLVATDEMRRTENALQEALQHEGLRADRLTGELERVRDIGLTQAAKLTTAEAFTIPNLKAALERYGTHESGCPAWGRPRPDLCTCGYIDALK